MSTPHDPASEPMNFPFGEMVERMPDAALLVAADGRIVYANRAVEELFGYAPPELLGHDLTTLIPERFHRRHAEAFARYMQHPVPRRMDNTVVLVGRHRDGHEIPLDIALTPLATPQGWLVSATFRDMTRHRDRTEELRKARDAAESANRAKSLFLANMSDEMRTPLNAVIGITELVLESALNTTQREYLHTVLESSESLLAIINEILDFAAIEAGQVALNPVVFNLREELGDMMKSLGFRAHCKELELAWRMAADVPEEVVGDPLRLRQVVVNLVGNAIKFTTHGEVVLEGWCERTTAAETELHFVVTDTGSGISADELGRIFEPFEQADTAAARPFGGTGLGLSVAATLVRMMNGRMWAESAVGTGSVFHFTAGFGVAPTAEAKTPPLELRSLQGLRVLVLDDNATNRRILKDILDGWGLHTFIAAGTTPALEILNEAQRGRRPIPLVVTDIHMPTTDGLMFTEQLRRTAALRDTIVIALSAGLRSEEAERCRQLGIARRLMKPVKQSELLATILSVCRDAEALGAAREPMPPPGSPPARSLRVLVAEDTVPNQKLVVGLLERGGHSAVVAGDGRQAVEWTAKQRFDLILMDIRMPVMDGVAATRAIRQRERETGGHVPILAMTANARWGDREQCLEAGMNGYITKPVRKWELYEAIAAVRPETAAAGGPSRLAATPPGPASGEVNWQAALESLGGDRDLLEIVVTACLDELPHLVEELGRAVRSSDPATIRRLAHSIHGSVRLFGPGPLFRLAGHIAEMGSNAELRGIEAVYRDLVRELPSFLARLRRPPTEGSGQ